MLRDSNHLPGAQEALAQSKISCPDVEHSKLYLNAKRQGKRHDHNNPMLPSAGRGGA